MKLKRIRQNERNQTRDADSTDREQEMPLKDKKQVHGCSGAGQTGPVDFRKEDLRVLEMLCQDGDFLSRCSCYNSASCIFKWIQFEVHKLFTHKFYNTKIGLVHYSSGLESISHSALVLTQ